SIPQLGGHVPFTVEKQIPGSFGLWQIQPSSANPKPAATYVGSFTIDVDGTLTFTAGSPAPSAPNILGISRADGVSTISFTTAPGGNYWLTYTSTLPGVSTTWPIVSGPIAGDGNNQSLSHTNSDDTGFYRVVRTP